MDERYYQENLKKLQNMQKGILDEVHKICIDNKIEYFLIDGTLLGAVRHDGFIPWDDDIDIGMTRENFEKFNNIAPKYLGDGYQLQNFKTDRKTPFAYSKVRKKGTKFVEYCNRNINMMNGVYIDIFPFDNVPNDEKERKRHFKKVKFLLKLFIYSSTPDITEKPHNLKLKLKYIIRRFIHYISKLVPKSYITRMLNKETTKYKGMNTIYKSSLLCGVYMWDFISVEDLYPIKNINFEGNLYMSPNNHDNYLKTVYGEYRKLPPKEKRKGHAPYIFKI